MSSTTDTSAKKPKKKGPPDWSARYKELNEKEKKGFTLPDSDKQVTITMLNGASRQAYVLGVAKDRATFSVKIPGNSEPQRATIERSKLNDKTRVMLWRDDAAKYHATMRVKKEKARYEKQHAPPPPEPEPVVYATPEGGTSSGGDASMVITPTLRGVKQNPDGSVDQVVLWLRDNINNPHTIRVIKWGKLVRDPRPSVKGYNIDVTFSSNPGGSLGVIRETKRFFFNREGSIVNTANVRQ